MAALLVTAIALVTVLIASTLLVVFLILRAPVIEDDADLARPETRRDHPSAQRNPAVPRPRLKGRAASNPIFFVPSAGHAESSAKVRLPR